MLKTYIGITGIICSLITWPIRMLFITIGVPNFKIIYKSGHVEKVFLNSINMTNGKWSWETPPGSQKTIVLFGVDDISAVYQIY